VAMAEPFSIRARPWERHGTALRQLAGTAQGALLDPWQLAPKVGLRVLDGGIALALLPKEDRLHLSGPCIALLVRRSFSASVTRWKPVVYSQSPPSEKAQ
jgi:hypothetical protein